MKIKKITNIIMSAAFLLLTIGIPVAGVAGYMLGYKVFSEENRSYAKRPSIKSLSDIFNFPKDFEAWLDDHLFFKNAFVIAKSRTELALLSELDSDQVIYGTEEPWLFYKRDDDGEALETYKHINFYTEDELSAIADALIGLKEDIESHGMKFIFYIAPDKETIYGSDYMPDYIKQVGDYSPTDQLIAYFNEHYPDLNIIYPKEELLSAKEEGFENVDSIYYKSDTHWNIVGSYVGMQVLMDRTAELFGTSYQFEDISFRYNGSSLGDLQRLALLPESYNKTDYELNRLVKSSLSDAQLDQSTMEYVHLTYYTTDVENCIPVTMYFCGDSFRNTSAYYISEATAKSYLVNRRYLYLPDVYESGSEVFVFETAERYLHDLDEIEGYNSEAMTLPSLLDSLP